MNFREQIINFYSSKKSFYELKGDDILCLKNQSSSCNDRINLYLKFNEQTLEDISFLGDGCAISLASTEVFCQSLKHKTKEEIKEILVNYQKMWNKEEFDKNVLGDLIIFSELATTNKRRKCANIVSELLEENIIKL